MAPDHGSLHSSSLQDDAAISGTTSLTHAAGTKQEQTWGSLHGHDNIWHACITHAGDADTSARAVLSPCLTHDAMANMTVPPSATGHHATLAGTCIT